MKSTLLALSLIVAVNAQAAVFHLRDVVLGTTPTQSDPVSHPWGSMTGYVEFEGPFREISCRAPCGSGLPFGTPIVILNWDIKVRDLNGKVIDRLTPNNTSGVQSTGGNVAADARYRTSFSMYNRNLNDQRGVELFFLAGIGVELERATLPAVPDIMIAPVVTSGLGKGVVPPVPADSWTR